VETTAKLKKTVVDILTKFGWETIDIGGVEGARLLEVSSKRGISGICD
jgi:predicted dinucleotide-binding enzyme